MFYGIDIQTRKELIAARQSVEEIRQTIGADSLAFLSETGLIEAIGLDLDAPILDCAWPISMVIILHRFMIMKKAI